MKQNRTNTWEKGESSFLLFVFIFFHREREKKRGVQVTALLANFERKKPEGRKSSLPSSISKPIQCPRPIIARVRAHTHTSCTDSNFLFIHRYKADLNWMGRYTNTGGEKFCQVGPIHVIVRTVITVQYSTVHTPPYLS